MIVEYIEDVPLDLKAKQNTCVLLSPNITHLTLSTNYRAANF